MYIHSICNYRLTLDCKLKFQEHAKNVTSKAKKVMGIIRRLGGVYKCMSFCFIICCNYLMDNKLIIYLFIYVIIACWG
jgi:hypothetical protein